MLETEPLLVLWLRVSTKSTAGSLTAAASAAAASAAAASAAA